MDFSIPSHVVPPGILDEVALAGRQLALRTKQMGSQSNTYPFDAGLPEDSLPSSMCSWVDRLPIDSAKNQIIETIRSADVTIITSETGSGKTTRVPQFILDDLQSKGTPCRIVVTEQRRLAAVSAAKWVAKERGERITYAGKASVGYAVKDKMVLPRSWNSIVYATEAKLLNVFNQGGFTHIVIDEAHEHRIAEDTLLMLCRQALLSRNHSCKLVLMTATINADTLKAYFAGAPQMASSLGSSSDVPNALVAREVNAQGRRHHVERVFLDDCNSLQHTVGTLPALSINDAVEWLFARYGPSDTLVFVADPLEIAACVSSLVACVRCVACPLHGRSGEEDMRRALTRLDPTACPEGSVKVIVATNVAEASVTIPGVRYVINYGQEKIPPAFQKALASKASQLQRAGRAGREADGVCLMMMPRSAFQNLPQYRVPETQTLPLHSLALFGLARGYIDEAERFGDFAKELPSPPVMERLDECIQELDTYGLTVKGKLTLLGKAVQKLPLDVDVAISLHTGVFLGVAQQLALVLAAASSNAFLKEFVSMPGARKYAEYPWGSGQHYDSDLYAAAVFLEHYVYGQAAWTGNDRVLREVIDFLEELRGLACDLGESDDAAWLEQVWPCVDFAFCSGRRMNVAVRKRNQIFRKTDSCELKLTKNTLLDRDTVQCVFYASSVSWFATGLHAASKLSLLTFAGKRVRKTNTDIVLDQTFAIPYTGNVHDSLLQLRTTVASLLSAFLESPSKPDIQRTLLLRLLHENRGPVACKIHYHRIPTHSAESSTISAATKHQPKDDCVSVKAVDIEKPCRKKRPVALVPDVLGASEAHETARQSCSKLPKLSLLPACPAHGAHKVSKARRGRSEYHFFAAVSAGCLTCVRSELEDKRQVAPDVLSESNSYSARDFAAYAVAHGVEGALEVQEYLEKYWSHLPVQI